jgi:transcriptional regulator with XRE-family HTH domain
MEDYKEGDARASKTGHDSRWKHGRPVPAAARAPEERTEAAIVRQIRKDPERDPSHGGWAGYLESAMRSAGLTQAELARRSGLAESMVSRWLRGLNQPDVPNLRRVGPVLGVPMLELLVAAGHVTLAESRLRDAPQPPGPVRVGIPTDGLTPEQVRQVEGYASYLRAQNGAAEPAAATSGPAPQRLRYAAYGGAKLTPEQERRVREQAKRAREQAERTGQPVVYLDEPGQPEG